MDRKQLIEKAEKMVQALAIKYNCNTIVCGEDRQKGLWGEEATKYFERKYGECAKQFNYESEERFIKHGVGGDKETPVTSVRFRFRFANPCIAIEHYEGQKQIFAEISISDFDPEVGDSTGKDWHISEYTVFDDKGLEYAMELRDEFHKLIAD